MHDDIISTVNHVLAEESRLRGLCAIRHRTYLPDRAGLTNEYLIYAKGPIARHLEDWCEEITRQYYLMDHIAGSFFGQTIAASNIDPCETETDLENHIGDWIMGLKPDLDSTHGPVVSEATPLREHGLID